VPLTQETADDIERWIEAEGMLLADEVLRVSPSVIVPALPARSLRPPAPAGRAPTSAASGRPAPIPTAPTSMSSPASWASATWASPTRRGEVYNAVARQLKAKSPFARTAFVELANGQANSGYIPTDDAFGRYTFQVLGSRLKPGCAESRTIRSPCLNRVSAAGRESAEPTANAKRISNLRESEPHPIPWLCCRPTAGYFAMA